MTTRHSRLSYTTLQFLYLLMHSTSLGNIHTAVFFFSYIESNTLLMSERQSDWEVGGGKKKISLPSIICDFTKNKTKAEQSGFFIWELELESEVVVKRQQTR